MSRHTIQVFVGGRQFEYAIFSTGGRVPVPVRSRILECVYRHSLGQMVASVTEWSDTSGPRREHVIDPSLCFLTWGTFLAEVDKVCGKSVVGPPRDEMAAIAARMGAPVEEWKAIVDRLKRLPTPPEDS